MSGLAVASILGPAPQRRGHRWAVEFLPPFAVALVLLPFIIAGGHVWPWRPSTIDLDVYVHAVRDMLAGKNIYETLSPDWLLTFIYPPVAAVLMAPLALGPYWLWQLVWAGAGVAAQQAVLARCGVPRGWTLSLAGVAIIVGCEPIRTTLGYGQVNTMLMFFVVADLLPRLGAVSGPGRRRWPRGIGIGLATAIKLTPALFAVFALVRGRWRVTLTAFVAFVGFTLIGVIFQPRQSLQFWLTLAGGDTRAPAGPIYVGNQSVLGVFARLVGESRPVMALGLLTGAVLALLAVVVAARLWRSAASRADEALAVGLVGLGTCLASPLSWTHHFVWVVPLGVGLLMGASVPTWARRLGLFWAVWTSACLPLAVLPYGGAEADYSWWMDLIGNLGTLCAAALVVGLAVVALRRPVGPPTA